MCANGTTYYDGEYEEYEEMVDNVPMLIANRVYLGSIDAVANAAALAAKDIRFVLSLLAPEDDLAAPAGVAHVRVAMDDSADEPLFRKLPFLLHTLSSALADPDAGNVLVHWSPRHAHTALRTIYPE